MTRKLATVRQIEEVRAIPDADKIVAYRIGGWWVVDSIDKYSVGDVVVYAEPDSWIPHSLAPFLSKGLEPRIHQGIAGERLRTIRLRKQLSQGLLLPFTATMAIYIGAAQDSKFLDFDGVDVSEQLGIIKWEPEQPTSFAGDVKGVFPSFIPKTDQERIQNLSHELADWQKTDITWEVQEKCEGQSVTVVFNDAEFDVCSRNLMLKESDSNTLWVTTLKYDLRNKLTTLGRNIAIQAELIGPKVQNNIYKLTDHQLAVFDIFDIDQKSYLTPAERTALVDQLGLLNAPLIDANFSLAGFTIDQLLDMADGKTVINKSEHLREGLVFKANTVDRISFKSVSNKYLLKTDN